MNSLSAAAAPVNVTAGPVTYATHTMAEVAAAIARLDAIISRFRNPAGLDDSDCLVDYDPIGRVVDPVDQAGPEDRAWDSGWSAGYAGEALVPPGGLTTEDTIEAWIKGWQDGQDDLHDESMEEYEGWVVAMEAMYPDR